MWITLYWRICYIEEGIGAGNCYSSCYRESVLKWVYWVIVLVRLYGRNLLGPYSGGQEVFPLLPERHSPTAFLYK